MAKRLREHVKYTVKELDQYTQTAGSCVRKVNKDLHLCIGPFCLADIKHILMAHLLRSKVGFYDVHLDGIVLDIKNVKILNTICAMRADDPKIHVNVNADVYLFQPTEGAELSGVVKHIGAHHVGVVLYRVFNVNLRVCHKVDKEEVQMDQNVKFRIQNYNLQNIFPYIDGELLGAKGESIQPKGKKIVFNEIDNADSGIEEKESGRELDELMSLIKSEESGGNNCGVTSKKTAKHLKKASESKKSSTKSNHEYEDSSLPYIKNEASSDAEVVSLAKKSKKQPRESTEKNVVADKSGSKQSRKKRKSTSESTSENIDLPDKSGLQLTPKKIKNEPVFSGAEDIYEDGKSLKTDKSSKSKTRDSTSMLLHIKQELDDNDEHIIDND